MKTLFFDFNDLPQDDGTYWVYQDDPDAEMPALGEMVRFGDEEVYVGIVIDLKPSLITGRWCFAHVKLLDLYASWR